MGATPECYRAGPANRATFQRPGETRVEASIKHWISTESQPGFVWFAKRLSAGETAAMTSHQRGPSIPRGLMLELFGPLVPKHAKTSAVGIQVRIDSHAFEQQATASWYDLKTFGGLRQESRLTGWRGGSLVTDPVSTGSLVVFVFRPTTTQVSMWLCRSQAEELELLRTVGPVEPGWSVVWRVGVSPPSATVQPAAGGPEANGSWPAPGNAAMFPSAVELLDEAQARCVAGTPDEQFIEVRHVALGLLEAAASMTEGRPMESPAKLRLANELLHLQLARFFGTTRTGGMTGQRTSGWPLRIPTGGDELHPPASDAPQILAVNAFCGNAWQHWYGPGEAPRILVTLQEGMDSDLVRAIVAAGISLVVPSPLWSRYPSGSRTRLKTMQSARAASIAPPQESVTKG